MRDDLVRQVERRLARLALEITESALFYDIIEERFAKEIEAMYKRTDVCGG